MSGVRLSENGTYKCELRSRDSVLSSVKHKLTVLGKTNVIRLRNTCHTFTKERF